MRALLAAMTVVAVWLSPPAFAQDAAEEKFVEELNCVYDALATEWDYEIVAEAFLYEGDKTGDIDGILTQAGAVCATEHGLSPVQLEAVVEYGRLAAVIDYLYEDMLYAGVSNEVLEKLFGVINDLSVSDYDRLFEDEWDETATGTVVRTMLKDMKFPDDEAQIAKALQLISLTAWTEDAAMLYFFDTGADEN